MSGAITAVAVGTVGSAIIGNQQAKAAEGAANAQKKAIGEASDVERERLAMELQQYQEQMAEYRRKQAMYEQQQAQTIRNLAPYMQAGQGALYEMMALTGMAAPQGATAPAATTGGITVPKTGGIAGGILSAPATTTGAGRMGILSGGYQPGAIGTSALQLTSPAAQEFQKGGLSLSSKKWDMIAPEENPRKEAADMLMQVRAEMPNATLDAQHQEAINRLNAQYGGLQQRAMLDEARAQVPTIEAATSPYAGLSGTQAQQQAMGNLAASPYSYESMSSAENLQKIAESPLLQALAQQGETGIMQNAAATGGLRGGRVQEALAQFRPQQMQEELMRRYTTGQSELANQYSRLQGIAGIGQQSILGSPTTAVGAMPTGGYDTSTLSGLLSQSGAAQAGGLLSQAAIQGNTLANIGQIAGWGLEKYGKGGFFPTGGGTTPTTAAPTWGGLGIGNPSNY